MESKSHNQPGLTLRAISKSYGQNRVLSELNLDFNPGEITILLGQNGSGKSTLLRLCAGLSRPDSGNISTPYARRLDTQTKAIGYLGHQTFLYAALTARENLSLTTSLMNCRASIEEHLNTWNLLNCCDRPCAELSKGQQFRAALARTFIHSPSILLLDEPSSSLDDSSMQILIEQLKMAASRSDKPATICVATHDTARFLSHSNRAIVLASGRIVDDSANRQNRSTLETINYYREINR